MNVESTRLESDRASAGRTHAHDHATDPGAKSEATASTATAVTTTATLRASTTANPETGVERTVSNIGSDHGTVGGRDAGERHDRRDREEQQRPVGVGRGPDRREQRHGGRRGEPRQPQRRRRGRRRPPRTGAGPYGRTQRSSHGSGRRVPGRRCPDRVSPVIARSSISGARRPRAAPDRSRCRRLDRRKPAQRGVTVGRERHDEARQRHRRPVRDGVADRHPRGSIATGRPSSSAMHERHRDDRADQHDSCRRYPSAPG